ncbi:MAG TPA: PPOX class F420-dependent oxidoreductase [Actinomycetes bacterium]|nr:PPOX class F420-dependent oxidoreductase [Actinomycetes bacterium]
MHSSGRAFVTTVTALTGALMLAAGWWGLVSPGSFADIVDFPASTHFLHDAGAFQLGIGATLLLALIWRDALAVVLAGFLVANTAHVVNHAVDLDVGGNAAQVWLLVAWSLLSGAALVVWLRQLGWVVGEVATATTPALEPFVRQKTVLLTSYRRDGTPVGAPVSLAVEGGHGFFRSPGNGWKVRRIRNNPVVEVAPCTMRGRPTGPALRARARQLSGAEAAHAARLLTRKHPLLHGVLVPLVHRAFRGRMGRTAHFELVPLDGQRAELVS